MAFDLEALGLHQLTVQERLLLIEQLWESLPDQVEPCDIPERHLAELARRRSLSQPGSTKGKPWREALSSLENGR